jgi:NAD+ kinase
MKIAIHGRAFKETAVPCVQSIFNELIRHGATLQINQSFNSFLKKAGVYTGPYTVFRNRKDIFNADMVFSIGGDGTLLETITYVAERQIPIAGINTGRLGFLATISNEHVEAAIQQIFQGYYDYDERVLIRLDSDRDLFGGTNFGLNEFTILKKDTSSMIVVHTYIDGEYLNSYWADGLIVATPTGSTGYSLSCGGPLVLPHSNNFVISPVSPHNLNVRPMVVSDSSVISFEIEGRSKNFLVSLDSRSKTVDATVQLAVRKEDFKARLVKLNGYNYLNTLRGKLNWGLDVRN